MLHVLVDMPTNTRVGEELLRGILRFARSRPYWSLSLVRRHDLPPRSGEGRLARYDGTIAYQASTTLYLPAIRRGLPHVGSALAPHHRLFAAEIACDNASVARLAAEHLLSRGFRHFAFVGSRPDLRWSRERRALFRRELRARGFRCAAFEAPPDATDGDDRALAAWLAALPRPVAVFADCDIRARDVLDACRDAGLAVPDDVAVLGVDDDELLCETVAPALSSVAMDVEEAGRRAAESLDAAMRGAPVAARRVAFGGVRVVARASTAHFVGRDPLVAKARSAIAAGVGERLAVSELARRLGVSRRTLEVRFRSETGGPVGAAILDARLERAKDLLRTMSLSLEEIAAACGICAASHMATLFRRRFGAPPSSFRKR